MKYDYPTLLHAVRQRAANTPDARAIIHEPSQEPAYEVTYLELWRRVLAVAGQVGATGQPGDRVVLLFPSGPEFVVAFLGCLLARRIAVPAALQRNARALERTVAIVRDAGAHLIVTTESMVPNLQAVVQDVRLTDGATPAVIAANGAGSEAAEDRIDCTPDDIAFLQYTSGSTAHPKGVMVAHENISNNLQHIFREFGSNRPNVLVNWLPEYHDMGLIGGILAPLYGGWPTVLMSPGEFVQRPVRWLELITKYGATISGGPNFAYDACVARVPDRHLESLDLTSWRVAFNGAEQIRAETVDRFAAKFARCGFDANAVFPCYGLAESTILVTCKGVAHRYDRVTLDREALKEGRVVESQSGRAVSACGGPTPDHDVAVVNPDTKQRCSETEVGEVWVSGPSVCRGYWGRDEDTLAAFSAELEGDRDKKFLRTGDLGLFRGGQLYITGRLKNIVIIRGLNYSCEDIEDLAQSSHRAVATATGAAFGMEGPNGEQLIVAQEINRGYVDTLDRDEVVAAIQESIVLHYGVRASDVVLVQPGRLPRTTSGKIQRQKTRDLYGAGKLSVVVEPDSSGMREAPRRAQGEG
jgi:acyl-CoA synthetase (AMP-forming)/AMP-acid ligase II